MKDNNIEFRLDCNDGCPVESLRRQWLSQIQIKEWELEDLKKQYDEWEKENRS